MSHRCDLCADARVTPLIEFGAHPIAHHFLNDPAQAEYTHPVTLGFCEACGLTKGSPVFEAGSNDGTFLAALRERGFTKLLGLEPAQGAVTAARKLGVETVRAYFTPTVARELAASFG